MKSPVTRQIKDTIGSHLIWPDSPETGTLKPVEFKTDEALTRKALARQLGLSTRDVREKEGVQFFNEARTAAYETLEFGKSFERMAQLEALLNRKLVGLSYFDVQPGAHSAQRAAVYLLGQDVDTKVWTGVRVFMNAAV